MNMTGRVVAILTIAALLTSQTAPVFAQGKGGERQAEKAEANFQALETYNLEKLEEKWVQYTKDKGFKALVDKAKSEGFERIANNERTAWGFQGEFLKGNSGKAVPAEVCAFDFLKKTPNGPQMASMLWRQTGRETYKALIVFPVGETNVEKAFANAVEHFADDAGNVKRAHSFNTCFNRCLKTSAGLCLGIAATCAGLITTIGITGLGVPAALGILGACAGICALPLAICAVKC